MNYADKALNDNECVPQVVAFLPKSTFFTVYLFEGPSVYFVVLFVSYTGGNLCLKSKSFGCTGCS